MKRAMGMQMVHHTLCVGGAQPAGAGVGRGRGSGGGGGGGSGAGVYSVLSLCMAVVV